jgi:hypothetical protein
VEVFAVSLRLSKILQGLAALQPKQLALMHGSAFMGNGEQALRDLAVIIRGTGRTTQFLHLRSEHHGDHPESYNRARA